MKRTTLGNLSGGKALSGGNALTFYNSGASRSRITLVTAGEDYSSPRRLAGSRWILFGSAAAEAFHDLLQSNSYLKLNDLIPGGMSSSTWQDMRASWQLEPPEVAAHGDLEFLNFGRHNSRVLLVRAGSAFLPERLDGTNIILLSPRARTHYAAFLDTLPAGTSPAHDAAARLVPGGLAGKALIRSRQLLRSD
jgi:hypothetical protein